MTLATAIKIAKAHGLNLVLDRPGAYRLIEARWIVLTGKRASKIAATEWEQTCSHVAADVKG